MANEELKGSYSRVVEVFSSLTAMRRSDDGGAIRDMADMARTMATKLGMSVSQSQDVYHAALLKDIGLMGFSDSMLNKPIDSMPSLEKEKIRQHPVIAQGLLMTLEPLQDVAYLIRCQNEYYDGSGYPDGLGTQTIPLGARILCVVGDYYGLQKGSMGFEKLNAIQARKFIQDHSGTRYDPDVVAALPSDLPEVGVTSQPKKIKGESVVNTSGLVTDMVLAADLVSVSGLVLLPKGYVVNDEVVQRVKNLEKSIGEVFQLHVTGP